MTNTTSPREGMDLDDEETWPICKTCGEPYWPATQMPAQFQTQRGSHDIAKPETCANCAREEFEDLIGYDPD